MTSFRRTILVINPLTLAVSCNQSSDRKDPLLEEAPQYHHQSTEIQAVVESEIEEIDSLKIIFTAQKKPASAARMATLDSLKKAFEEWEENLVEVPGMPHEHNHNHGKGEHTPAAASLKDLPAGQMRDLQREILNNLKRIQSRLDAVTQAAR